MVADRYYKEIKNIVDGLRPGDRLIVTTINSNPLTESEVLVQEEIPGFNPIRDNLVLHKKKVKKTRGAILSKVRAIVYNQSISSEKTKIMDGLIVAGEILNSYGDHDRVLLVFTDGFEEGDHYDFVAENLSEKRTGQIIGNEKSGKRLPDLTGVRLCMTGIGVGIYGDTSTEKLLSVRNFWLKYFTAAGAIVSPGSIGNPNLDIESIRSK